MRLRLSDDLGLGKILALFSPPLSRLFTLFRYVLSLDLIDSQFSNLESLPYLTLVMWFIKLRPSHNILNLLS